MIARHDGAIVFVSGAIPGEVVDAEIEKVQRGTAWAATREVLERSPDRVDGAPDGACGGSVFAHIAYERQRQIKSAIIDDAFRRIGRITLDSPADVVASPVDGYRMRARLHVRNGRIGFFREGTHSLCDAASTRQLRDDTIEVIRRLESSSASESRQQVGEIEIAENIDATERAIHLELLPDADPSRLAALARVDGVTGASCAHPDNPRTMELFGSTIVSDEILGVRLDRHVTIVFPGQSLPAAAVCRVGAAARGEGTVRRSLRRRRFVQPDGKGGRRRPDHRRRRRSVRGARSQAQRRRARSRCWSCRSRDSAATQVRPRR